MMELRSYNVEKVWSEVVTIRIGDGIGIRRDSLALHTEDIRDMISQLPYKRNMAMYFNTRIDGETWTPYMQIVEMLLLLGAKLGFVQYKGKLSARTIITITI